jgi:hypothetical protein
MSIDMKWLTGIQVDELVSSSQLNVDREEKVFQVKFKKIYLGKC